MATSIGHSPAWLDWVEGLMRGVSRQTHAATFPSDRYYCLLDELPLHLVPRPSRRWLSAEKDPHSLFLNPNCALSFGEELPDRVRASRELFSRFALQGTIAWVPDSRGGMLPFWLGAKLETFVRNLRPMEPVPPSLPPIERALLAAAGILRPEAENAQSDQALNKAAVEFQKKGYTPLRSLIHPFHVAALRRYYRNRIRCGAIPLGDRQSSRRYAAYNEPVARYFHHQISSTLTQVAGENLKPSYVYLASYVSGAELKKHIDRAQCEFSVTFCLDYSPEPALATPWPIRLDAPDGVVTVYQALGDGLAYRGTQLPHYRTTLGENQTSTSIFFHYVRSDFEGSLG